MIGEVRALAGANPDEKAEILKMLSKQLSTEDVLKIVASMPDLQWEDLMRTHWGSRGSRLDDGYDTCPNCGESNAHRLEVEVVTGMNRGIDDRTHFMEFAYVACATCHKSFAFDGEVGDSDDW